MFFLALVPVDLVLEIDDLLGFFLFVLSGELEFEILVSELFGKLAFLLGVSFVDLLDGLQVLLDLLLFGLELSLVLGFELLDLLLLVLEDLLDLSLFLGGGKFFEFLFLEMF